MAVTANALRVSTTLRLGERVLVRCDDGLLATEYVLFDATDIVLRATDPVTVRETGYITTVRDALARLAGIGITAEIAHEAAHAMTPEIIASFARTEAVGAVAADLTACELFDGAVYRAASRTYEGTWLDLRALATALGRADAPTALQCLFLATALEEVSRSTPLHLSTTNATRNRRPGERTHRRVAVQGADDIPNALRKLAPNAHRAETNQQRDRFTRDALLLRVRERASAQTGTLLRAHLAKLENTLAPPDARSTGALADPELWAIEQQLGTGDARGVREKLEELERIRGSTAAIRYLRARAALVSGEEAPGSVAQAVSVIANEDRGFHEAELVAARAWLAAGEEAYARHFARRLAEDETAPVSERVIALEILEATSATTQSQSPPPVHPSPAAAYVVAPTADEVAAAPFASFANAAPAPDVTAAAFGQAARVAAPPPGASLPPVATMPPVAARSAASAAQAFRGPALIQPRYEPELVESLALPLGATEEILAVGDWPTTPLQVRTAMTRLARSLARDYRLWYGTTLRCNVLAVDAMQRHLAQRFVGANLTDPKIESELQRHGGLLSEILARTLGAEWVDISPTEPGYWAMLVASTRFWPIGRVYRFVTLGRSERDLVSYYLDIEARAKA
jgi:hypothetical protein